MADSVSPISSLHYIKSDSSDSSGGLNVDTKTFLKLLVAQTQYQDPMEPQSNTEFVAELAQMSSQEQMETMNDSLNVSKALSFVGGQVYAEVLDSDTGITNCYSGVADGVVMKNGTAYVVVGNNAICVDDIVSVGNAPNKTSTDTGGSGETDSTN